jgi:hypothetical protein
MSATSTMKPWYREVWPWLLMLPPLASVVGGVTMVYLAVGAPEALVVEDYARIEEITRERAAAERRAFELGVAASVERASGRGGAIAVRLELDGDAEQPSELVLTLRHVAFEAADRSVLLARVEDVYLGTAALAAGRYELDLAPADSSWLVSGTLADGARAVRLEAAVGKGRR